jgi:hypothetical protein
VFVASINCPSTSKYALKSKRSWTNSFRHGLEKVPDCNVILRQVAAFLSFANSSKLSALAQTVSEE